MENGLNLTYRFPRLGRGTGQAPKHKVFRLVRTVFKKRTCDEKEGRVRELSVTWFPAAKIRNAKASVRLALRTLKRKSLIMETKMTIELTEGSKELFIALIKDAGNWSGVPLFGGNVGHAPADKGHLTDLKKKGLLTTDQDEDNRKCHWVYFTEEGKKLGKELDLGDWMECLA